MKKIFLLASVALLAASSITAQESRCVAGVHRVGHDAKAPLVIQNVNAQIETKTSLKAKRVRPNAATKIWYYRPAGQFYRGVAEDGTWYEPMVYMRPYAENTTVNASTGATSFTWSYQMYDNATQNFITKTANTTDLVDTWVNNTEVAAPILSSGSNKYQLSTNHASGGILNVYDGLYCCTADPYEASGEQAYVSPKYFGGGNRSSAGNGGGIVNIMGASSSLTDPNAGGAAWFGHNYSGWNANGIYAEKPVHPYALRGVSLLADALELVPGASSATLTATIYKASKDENDKLVLGDVLVKTTADITSSDKGRMFINFPLLAVEDGIESEVTLEIDDAIFIAITGLDNTNIKSLNIPVSTDTEYEGYGDVGYIFYKVPGDDVKEAEQCRGFAGLFRNSSGEDYQAQCIFMDVEYPFVVLNYTADKAEYEFPVAGGEVVKTISGKEIKGVAIYSSKTADEFDIIEKGKEELPEWLSIELEDVMTDGEYNGLLQANVVAEPLPAGVKYRECVVDFGVAGGHLYYTFTQGDKTAPVAKPGDVNNDGSVDIKDLNIVINIVLGQDSAAKYDGRADVNGDSRVDIVDVNAIINLILG